MPRTVPAPELAIVGLGGVFPGAHDLNAFWQLLLSGQDSVTEPGPERWAVPARQGLAGADEVSSRRACLIRDWQFSSAGLALAPERIEGLDPMYLLLLAAGRAAWLDCRHESLDRGRVGVVVGNIVLPTEYASRYSSHFLAPGCCPPARALNRHAAGLPAGLLAEALGLGGVAWTLDAACASSLYALKYAVDALAEGRADMMLTGGLARPDCLYTQMGFSQLQALSPSGRCSPLDHKADGLVVGEGCGMLAIKRLADALADGDTIYATVAGIGLGNDIAGNLMQPDSDGQLRAMRAAYQQAGWPADCVQYIECHGTGTPVGDAVEFASLCSLWHGLDTAGGAVLGSVKANVGHLLTAAGAASLIKTCLALRHRVLPPTAHFERPPDTIALHDSPFEVLSAAREWPDAAVRRAAVSGFGFGGVNAHVLLQEHGDSLAATGAAASVTTADTRSAGTASPVAHSRPSDTTESAVRSATASARATDSPEPVAIVGLAARLGNTSGVEALLQLLLGAAPPDEINACGPVQVPMGRYSTAPRELQETLPQQVLMLEMAYEALREAGLSQLGEAERVRTGVFVGVGLDMNACNFHLRWLQHYRGQSSLSFPPLNANRTMGALGSIVASRIARAFAIAGPSFTVSSEGGSGLQALALGLSALRRGELDQVLVGAVDLPSDLRARPPGRIVHDTAIAFVLQREQDARSKPVHALIGELAQTGGTMGSDVFGLSTGSACAPELNGVDALFHRPAEYAGAATAMLGVLRAVLALRHRLLPGERYWLWDRCLGPRRVQVRFAGINRERVTLQEADAPPGRLASLSPERLFLLAANDRQGLSRQLAALRFANPTAGQAATGPLRAAILAEDESALRASSEKLLSAIDAERAVTERGVWYSPAAPGGELAFVFPGFGNHFADMGRALGAAFPEVLERQHRDNARLAQQFGAPRLWQAGARLAARDALFAQVSLGMFITDVLADFAVRPQAVIGYSLGETTGLFATRAWQQRDEMLRRMHDSDLFTEQLSGRCLAAQRAWGTDQPVQWLTAVVRVDAAALRQALGSYPRVYLLLINAPGECVVGGERNSVLACLKALGIPLRHALDGVITVHCEVAEQVRTAYRALHLFDDTQPAPGVRYYSGSAGRAYTPNQDSAADSITQAALGTVDFVRLVETAWEDGVRVFVEPGPGASCTRMIQRILGARPHLALSICTARGQELHALLCALARLHCCGLDIAQQALARREPPQPVVSPGQFINVCSPELPACVPVAEAEAAPPQTAAPVATPTHEGLSQLPLGLPQAAAPVSRELGAGVEEDDARPVRSREVASANPLIAQMQATAAATAAAEAAFLDLRAGIGQSLSRAWVLQAQSGLERAPTGVLSPAPGVEQGQPAVDTFSGVEQPGVVAPSRPQWPAPFPWSRQTCLRFATGRIADVLGPDFAAIDAHPTRVRLPAEPLMLVDRVLGIEGEANALARDLPDRGCIVTEHVVQPGAWYLDGGRIPTCIAVEAGQADLLLSAWLGIDHRTRGEAVYRLLDATVEFHATLPGAGDTITYTIHIERFFRQGDTWLFRFHFEATVNGRALLSMREGCAGFFTAHALASGQGIVDAEDRRLAPDTHPAFVQANGTGRPEWQGVSAPDRQRSPASAPADGAGHSNLIDAEPLVPMAPESIDDQGLRALRAGDLAACFGPVFADLPWPQGARLPGGRMALVHRICLLDPFGGRHGRGYIKGEADIGPQDWFLTCHFVDDQVMPGTLMYECCLHTLRVFLLRMGWVGAPDDCVHEPIPGVVSRLKCRGQVTPATRTVHYEITIRALGYQPDGTPCVIADALMHADYRPIVRIQDMSLRLGGLRRESLVRLWRGRTVPPATSRRSVLFDKESILAFAEGKPSVAFGARYRVFDEQRRIARLPRPPYQFLDRITAVADCVQWHMRPGGRIEAEYDVARDGWYFTSHQAAMPFAVLLEAALQPCGWLAAYLGSALCSDEDLSFRNLGGSAVQHRLVGPDSGVLRSSVAITSASQSGGMIIQHYRYALRDRQGLVYVGDTYFGFFPQAALREQRGIANASLYQPDDRECARAEAFPYPDGEPFPEATLRMVDDIVHFDMLGGKGLGFVRGRTRVRPKDWFFAAHFYQDPVWPGSLGLESLLQLLKVYARRRFGTVKAFQCMAPGQRHAWTYRGQIVPGDREVIVEAMITRVDEARGRVWADGQLAVDGRLIYQMEDFCLQVRVG